MSDPTEALKREVTAILENSHCLTRFYQTISLLDSLSQGIADKIVRARQTFKEMRRKGKRSTCTLLADKIFELLRNQYALAKEKVEVTKQFEEIIDINKRKLEEALECFIKAPLPQQLQPPKRRGRRPKVQPKQANIENEELSPDCTFDFTESICTVNQEFAGSTFCSTVDDHL